MKPSSLSRRQFVKTSAGAVSAAAIFAQRKAKAISPSGKVVIGVMGLGGRGSYIAGMFANRPDTDIAYICDVDTRKFARVRASVEEAQGKSPKQVQDFRKILEDKSVDVLINATPDHWHAMGAIMACQAGKDVYVEKPMCHNIWEGRKMIEASKKYKRVIQVGMQSRSAQYLRDATEYIKSGKLGDVYLVRVFNMMQHPMRKKLDQPAAVPDTLNYDMWCGPAPVTPYDPGRRWLDMWEYSCGAIAGDMVHQIDLARFLMGDKPYPDTVCHAGGVNSLCDGREIPDTQIVTFEFGKLTMLFEAALWTPYMTKTPMDRRDKGVLPSWPFNATRIEVLGTKGFMYYGRHGDGWQVFSDKAESVVALPGKQADKEHQDNFIACVKNRKQPNANVEQGHYSALLCHVANASYRVGNKKLVFDGATETFKNDPEANKFIKRTYRSPWVIPDSV